VPEDSVRPETLTLFVFNRRKGYVGGLKKLSNFKLESNRG